MGTTPAAEVLRLNNLAPEIALTFPDALSKAWLSIWEPYLLACPMPSCVVAETAGGKRTDEFQVPIFFRDEGITSGRLLKTPSLKIFLYPTNRPNNFVYLNKFPQVKHVFVGHGDSDKMSSSSRFSTVYDFLLVADDNACARYASRGVNIPEERFITMGPPVIPGLQVRTEAAPIRSVLYAPTSEGKAGDSNFSSLLTCDWASHLAQLNSGGLAVDFRPHPGTGQRLAQYRTVRDQLVSPFSRRLSKAEAFNNADVLVCDVSGVMSEFLFTGKPIIVPVHKKSAAVVRHAVERAGLRRYTYLWDGKLPLLEFIASIQADPLRGARLAERNARFCGAMSFEESSGFFNRAMQIALSS